MLGYRDYVLMFRGKIDKEFALKFLKDINAIIKDDNTNTIFVTRCTLNDIIDIPIKKRIISKTAKIVVSDKEPNMIVIY